jgi:hypothetical protein
MLGQAFLQERQLEHAKASATVLLGHGDAQVTGLAQLVPQFTGEALGLGAFQPIGAVVFSGDAIGVVQDAPLFLGKLEIHVSS